MKRTIRQTTLGEEVVRGGRQLTLEFRVGSGTPVPAILLLPNQGEESAAALMLHGYSSRKEMMAETVGRALLHRGIASLAIDLPLHGDREDTLRAQAVRNPLVLMKLWREALEEAALAVQYLAARREVDGGRLAIVGYSLGSFLAVLTAARQPKLRAVVVAAGGDLPSATPFGTLVRTVADPLRAVRKLEGRPLLVVHGRNDRTVLPEQAQRLYDAAGEPKEIRWWDAGHYLPAAAVDDAAGWLEEILSTP